MEKYCNTPGSVKFTLPVNFGAKEIMDLIKNGRIKDVNDSSFHNGKYTQENLK